MTDNNKEIYLPPSEIQILDAPGHGLPERNVMHTIAGRLVKHHRGKVAGGWNHQAGRFVAKWDKGDLLQDDALYATEFAVSHGLNPVGDISIWYIGGKLIVAIYWRILKGWAEMVAPFRTEFIDMTEVQRQRHGLQSGDLGVISYNILDADKDFYREVLMAAIKSGLKLGEAHRQAIPLVAKGSGVGIVLSKEMTKENGDPIAPPKGRSWPWRAETRSFRDAIGRSHGNPTPVMIKKYAEENLVGIAGPDLPVLADPIMDDLNPAEQQRYLELNADLRKAKTKRDAMTPEELHAESQVSIDLMRGSIEDEETALGEEPDREDVEDGAIEETTPPPVEAEVKRHARIMGGFDWGTASRKLAFQCPIYALENGSPNMSKILTEAWEMGFKQIDKENINDLLAALSDIFNQPNPAQTTIDTNNDDREETS